VFEFAFAVVIEAVFFFVFVLVVIEVVFAIETVPFSVLGFPLVAAIEAVL